MGLFEVASECSQCAALRCLDDKPRANDLYTRLIRNKEIVCRLESCAANRVTGKGTKATWGDETMKIATTHYFGTP